MKVEEAREILKSVREKGFRYTMYTLGQFHEALDMAIESLSEPKMEKRIEYGTDGNMYELSITNGKELSEQSEDAIPRSTAITLVNDVQNNRGFSDYKYYEYLYDHLSTLPSVNPQEPICPSAGVDCEDCPAYEPKWTLISESLPEDGKIAVFTDGNIMSIERYKSDAIDHFFPEGRWFSFENAKAWMPLPEPYKTESEVTE